MTRNLFAAFATAIAFMPAPSFAASETAIFAGGCFWCVEKDMDHIKGVTKTTSGYAGGTMANPTYLNHEGYREAVKVEFDPAVVSYDELVARFLRTIDVTDDGGQFCDRGESYQTGLFPKSEKQKAAAQRAIADAEKVLGQKIATPIISTPSFAPAEAYHQDYYQGENRVLTRFGLIRQSEAYRRYREACGRDARVKKVWGKEAYTEGTTATVSQ